MALYVLGFGPLRTGQLQRSMPGISKKMLTQTLRELEMQRLVDRRVHQVVPPMVEYSLTDLGRQFLEPLMALYQWAEDNAELLDAVFANRAHGSASLAPANDEALSVNDSA